MELLLSCLTAFCFSAALIAGKRGLRTMQARAGAAISVPTATALFAIGSPFLLDLSGFSLQAVALFALLGLFFPALVTLLTFQSNHRLGPTVTAMVSGTAPIFAIVIAALLVGEKITGRAVFASLGVAAGIAILSWAPSGWRTTGGPWLLWIPLCGAFLRGLAQALAKAALLLWPNPFAMSLVSYVVSCAVVVAANRVPRTQPSNSLAIGVAWFAVTGVLNGAGVLFMYTALKTAPVAMVAPIIASYPLLTALMAAAFREERLTAKTVAGGVITVGSVAFLVAG